MKKHGFRKAENCCRCRHLEWAEVFEVIVAECPKSGNTFSQHRWPYEYVCNKFESEPKKGADHA